MNSIYTPHTPLGKVSAMATTVFRFLKQEPEALFMESTLPLSEDRLRFSFPVKFGAASGLPSF